MAEEFSAIARETSPSRFEYHSLACLAADTRNSLGAPENNGGIHSEPSQPRKRWLVVLYRKFMGSLTKIPARLKRESSLLLVTKNMRRFYYPRSSQS